MYMAHNYDNDLNNAMQSWYQTKTVGNKQNFLFKRDKIELF